MVSIKNHKKRCSLLASIRKVIAIVAILLLIHSTNYPANRLELESVSFSLAGARTRTYCLNLTIIYDDGTGVTAGERSSRIDI